MKLSLLEATIKELTDKMAELGKFTNEANNKYKDTNTCMSVVEKVFHTITAEKALDSTILQLEGQIRPHLK